MKKKLSLNDLNVQSFVTDVDQKELQNVMGGATLANLCNGNNTLPLYDCISAMNYSACQTCGFACTSQVNCPATS